MKLYENILKSANEGRTSIIYKDESLSYMELYDLCIKFATYLEKNYSNDNAPVVIYGHKDMYIIPLMFGSVLAKRPYVPIDTTVKSDRLESIVNQVNPSCFINLSGEDLNSNTVKGAKVLTKSDILDIINNTVPHEFSFDIDDEQVCYILFTSGSTGTPKGVPINWKNISHYCKNAKILHDDNANSNVFNAVSYSFDVSNGYIFESLLNGCTLHTIDKEMLLDLKKLFEYLENHEVNIYVFTPSMAELLLSSKKFNSDNLPELKEFHLAGEVLTPVLAQKLFDRFENVRIFNEYGPTEATVIVTQGEIFKENVNDKSLTIGKPINGIVIKIVDEKGIEVQENEPGELLIIGDSVANGYYKRDDLTEKVFFYDDETKSNGYKSGDLAYRVSDNFYYLGRNDNQLKVNGNRIELDDIEVNLNRLNYINTSCVIPIKSNGKFEHLIAYIVLSEKLDMSNFQIQKKVKADLNELIPTYMIPRVIIVEEELPLTVSYKIDRVLLEKKYMEK